MIRAILVVLSSVLSIVAVWQYIFETVKGRTKPRIVSWFTWSLLTGIAAFASWSDHQYPAAILAASAMIETLLVVIVGFRYGDRKFTRLDVVCQTSALLGLAAWWFFDSPEIAVLATVVVDFVGSIPTFVHSWKSPHEETWSAFLLSALGALATILAAQKWQVTAVAYPAYLFIVGISTTAILLLRPKSLDSSATETTLNF